MKRKKSRIKARARKRSTYVANPSRRRRKPSLVGKVFSSFKRRRHSYRRNPDVMEGLKMILFAALGALALPKVIGMAPMSVSKYKNPILALLGLGAAAMMWHKNRAVAMVGIGAATVGVRNMVVNRVPMLAGANELTDSEISRLSAYPNAPLDGEDELLGGPLDGEDELLGGPLDGEDELLGGPLDGEDELLGEDELNGAFSSQMTSPAI